MNWSTASTLRLTDAPLHRSRAAPAPRAPAPAGDEAELLRQARAGEGLAFRALYDRSAPAVHALLRAQVSATEAEDLHQETFAAAWQGLHRLQDGAPFRPWLFGIARNLLRHHLRRRPRPASHAAVDGLVAAEADEPAARSQRAEGVERVRAALGRLPEAERELLALRLIECLSAAEIASWLGGTPGSIRVRVHRALRRLRALLDGDSA